MIAPYVVDQPLELLTDEANVYVGRKQSVFSRHKSKAALYIGQVAERQTQGRSLEGRHILLDSISPHAIFICGMRGSGKSYTLGVIAEEMAEKNNGAGVIIIDPMGIFWSMKRANKVSQEKRFLRKWGLGSKGFENVRVFLPTGHAMDAPEDTFDSEFTIRPNEISVEEWCLTFSIDRFDTMGLLIERAIDRVRKGYTSVDGRDISAKDGHYDVEDVIECINEEEGINSSDRGFKQTTRRALVARLNGARDWGIFAKEGTKLNDLSKRGVVSVIDVSFLDDNVRALVVGIIARNLLNTRKLISRHEATGNLKDIFGSIPVTWLMIDEAHILVPASGQKTAATDSIIEYVRQGRQPGCSLVLATQQPSAIDSRVLSQTDILMCHKLVYDDDIKAVTRRMPSEMPAMFKDSHFIKNLPIGTAIIGDKQEQTSRAFISQIRPRISQHEGRERTSTMDIDPKVLRDNIKELVADKYAKGEQSEVPDIIASIKEEYEVHIDINSMLCELVKEGKVAADMAPPAAESPIGAGEVQEGQVTIDELADKAETSPPPDGEDITQDSGVADVLDLEPIGQVADTHEIVHDVSVPAEKDPLTVSTQDTGLVSPDDDPSPFFIKSDIEYVKKLIVPPVVDEQSIAVIAEKRRKGRFFSKKSDIVCMYMVFYPLWRVMVDYFPRKDSYHSLAIYVDGITGEYVINGRTTRRTKGVRELAELKAPQRDMLNYLFGRESATYGDIEVEYGLSEKKAVSVVAPLLEQKLVDVRKKGEHIVVSPASDFILVSSPIDRRLKRIEYDVCEQRVDKKALVDHVITKSKAKKAVELFEHIEIWDTDKVYYPYWAIVYDSGNAKRYDLIDAVTSKEDDGAKKMLRFRI